MHTDSRLESHAKKAKELLCPRHEIQFHRLRVAATLSSIHRDPSLLVEYRSWFRSRADDPEFESDPQCCPGRQLHREKLRRANLLLSCAAIAGESFCLRESESVPESASHPSAILFQTMERQTQPGLQHFLQYS